MTSAESCGDCNLILWEDQYPEDDDECFNLCQRLFHDDCNTCSLRQHDHPQQLCDSCKHFRLDHHLFCTGWLSASYLRFDISHMVRGVDEQQGSSCDLCQFVRATYDSRLKPAGTNKVSGFEVQLMITDPHNQELSLSIYAENDSSSFAEQKVQIYNIADLTAAEHRQILQNAQLMQPSIDWTRARGWLEICSTAHDTCESMEPYQPAQGFRVIDTEQRCLVSPSKHLQFLALSYVWGEDPPPSILTATQDNINDLEIAGSLDTESLCPAIADAMQITSKLGFKYLWVDRLCIVQDDDRNREANHAAMQDIYSRATIVLVHCTGESSEDRISGIGRRPLSVKNENTIGSMHIVEKLPTIGETALSSKWSTRGWTYQEAVLAKRILFFTEYQLIYQCSAGVTYEDNLSNDDYLRQVDVPSTLPLQSRIRTITVRETYSRLEAWSNHVAVYKQRQLKYPSDICKAFSGIAGALYFGPSSIHYGHPCHDFDHSLLWYERHPDTAQEPSGKAYTPSWSWGNAKGYISHFITPMSFCGTLVTWWRARRVSGRLMWTHVYEAGEMPHEPWSNARNILFLDPQSLDAPQLYMAIALLVGCLDVHPEPLACSKIASLRNAAMRMTEEWPDYSAYMATLFKCDSFHPPARLPHRPDLVATRAQLAQLRMRRSVASRTGRAGWYDMGQAAWYHEGDSGWFEIIDAQNQPVGFLAPASTIPANSRSGEQSLFAALSIGSLNDDRIGRSITTAEYRRLNQTISDEQGIVLTDIPVVYVMCVKRLDGIYKRLGIGYILLTKWCSIERWTETIVLA